MPTVTSQTSPQLRAASILEANARSIAQNTAKEAEWNTVGLTSGLNPIEFGEKKRKETLAEMAEVLN